MLFVLAWLLWLHHQPYQRRDEQNEEDDDVVTITHSNSLKSESVSKEKKEIVSEGEIVQSVSDVSHHGMFDGFEDWEITQNNDVITTESEIKEAKLSKQQSLQANRNDADVVCVVEDANLFVGTDLAYTEPKHAQLSSQPSIKRDRAKLYSPNSSFTPVQRGKTSDKNESGHSTSSLNIQVHNDESFLQNKVSVYETDLNPSPRQHHFGAVNVDQESLEDNEVAEAFSFPHENEAREDEDMQYKTRNGTKVTIKHEAAGRIHSIVVKDKTKNEAKLSTKPSRIRIASPRMRATSPRVRAENVSPSIISMHQHEAESDGMVHLVINKNHLDVDTTSREHVVLPSTNDRQNRVPVMEDAIIAPINTHMVHSGNPDLVSPKPRNKPEPSVSPKPAGKQNLKSPVGKLPPQKPRQIRDPKFLEKPTKAPTDFDAIMNKRKKFVDTMDDAGRLLGQIAHRDEKLAGGRKQLSKHWLKIKEAVLHKQYLNFKNKPMR